VWPSRIATAPQSLAVTSSAPYLAVRAAASGPAAAPGGHPGQRSAARSAGEPEQDGFRLVVEGVAEQDRGGTVLLRRLVERAVPGHPGSRFRASRRVGRRHRDHGAADRVEAELAQQRRHARGALAGTRLQPMVDGHAAGPQVQPRRHERRGRGQRERVGATGTGDEHQVTGG
jgi:hypothetical protein